jgi:hypothetical protein
MIKSGASNVRKFDFFDIQKESEIIPEIPEEIPYPENTPIHLQESNINISNVTISGAHQMHAINGLVFINGKAIHKKEGKNIRESLIMKIYNNKIIDEYHIYNGVYYDFSLKYYQKKPYFVIIGGNFNEYIIDGQKELFMVTSIKIYNALPFITNKESRLEVPPSLRPTEEPYPKFLVKKIKILKRLSDDKLFCDDGDEDNKMEGCESFQNINAFHMSDNFTHAAISLDKGGILLIYGKPNLLECNTKDMKIIYLPKIIVNEREVHITNLNFAELNVKNEFLQILYATTANSVYYFSWKGVDEKSNLENKIILKELNQDKKGAYSGCIDVKDKYLLMGSSNDDFIGEYDNLEFSKTWFFDGKKTIVKYFEEYLMFVIFGETESSLQIYDKRYQYFVYYYVGPKKITGVCFDKENYIYIFIEEAQNKKRIVKLKEKTNQEKFQIFFEKKFYVDAALYAENCGIEKYKIFEIYKQKADYEYSKGDFASSINEYIKTINYYKPSNVIQKFLEKSKLDFLIKYLEAIVNNIDIKIKDLEEHKNYTTLLLNCYVMEDDFEKLKNFIDKKGNSFSEDITKSIIDICLDTEKIDLSLQISKQFKLTEEYLKIMITKLNKYDEALDIIENPDKNQFQITTQDKIDLYYKFSNYFLSKENFDEKFFSSVSKFIENNAIGIEKKDLNKLIDIFIEYDKFFKILFEKIGTLQLNYEKNMIHKRIELYIQDGLEENKNNILQIIRNEKFVEKYDTQYLIMLFKYYNFKEGLEVLYEVNKINQDLLMIYIEKKEYKKIISLCEKYGMVNISLWWRSLEFFLGKEFRKDLNEEEKNQLNIFFEEFLMKLLESDTLIDLNILEYINDINNDIPLSLINNFLTKAFERHYTLLSDQEKNFQEYDKEINTTLDEIKEIRTKGYILDFKECNECSLPLSLPFISFNCGHVYHNLCFYSHFTSGGKKFCRKCKEKKDKIEDEYKKIKIDGEKFNDINKLENEIGKNKDNDFMHQLYGKGIINISPITDEDIASKNINFNK